MPNDLHITQINGNQLTVEIMKQIIDQGSTIYVLNGCTESQATLFKRIADDKKRNIVVIKGIIIG